MSLLCRCCAGLVLALLLWLPLAARAADKPDPAPFKVGLLGQSHPYHVWPQGGAPAGYDVDLLERLARDSGLRFELRRYDTWDSLLKALMDNEVQLVTSTAQTPERLRVMRFTRPYSSSPQGFAGARSITSVPSTPDLAGRRLAVARGFATETIAATRFPLAARKSYATESNALDAVHAGEADFVLGSAPGLRALLAERPGTPLEVLRTFGFPEGQRRLAAAERNGELIKTLDAALGKIDAAQFARWAAAWTERWEQRPLAPLQPGAEVAPLRVGYFGTDAPYTRRSADGQAEGITIDMLQAVMQRAGLAIASREAFDLRPGIEALQSGRIDLLLGMADTQERRKTMSFVGPYRSSPMALVSRENDTVATLEQLGSRRLALVDGYFASEYLRNTHPDAEVVLCTHFDACLMQVERGEADATIFGLEGLYQRLAANESRLLRVSGILPDLLDEQNLALSPSRRDIGERLRDALEVVLRTDMPRIEREWGERAIAPHADWTRVRRWLGGAAALLLALLVMWWWHSRALRSEIARTRAARNESEQYLAFMAHEVRNSLQSVTGAVALLRGSSRPDSRQAPLLEALGRTSRSTLGLLNGLLDRHRLHEGRLSLALRPESIERVLIAVIEETQPAARAKGLTLRFERASEIAGWWQIDALRVQQIVRNLLVNAVKFSERGTITLRAGLLPSSRGPAWRRVVIEVVDEGPGIDAAALSRVFERFETAGGDRPGSGLGLNLSRELARALGGTLDAASPPGQGARFTLAFDAEAAPDSAARRGERLERVLVVEDSPVYGLLLTQALNNQGATTVLAESIAQAREALIASVAGAGDTTPSFDLVLSDTNLGDGHVTQLLRFMRDSVRPGVELPPVICISADFAEAEGDQLIAAGAADLLVKDSDVAAFASRVLRSYADRATADQAFK